MTRGGISRPFAGAQAPFCYMSNFFQENIMFLSIFTTVVSFALISLSIHGAFTQGIDPVVNGICGLIGIAGFVGGSIGIAANIDA